MREDTARPWTLEQCLGSLAKHLLLVCKKRCESRVGNGVVGDDFMGLTQWFVNKVECFNVYVLDHVWQDGG